MKHKYDPELAEKIRSGEYFREARRYYSDMIHNPMSERYFYIFITVASVLVLFVAIQAARALFPLQEVTPLVVYNTSVVEDVPHVMRLMQKGETPDAAMRRFLLSRYVEFREGYDIDKVDQNITGVKIQSTPEVFASYEKFMNPENPESPVTLYERHSRRVVQIVSVRYTGKAGDEAEVLYDAYVVNGEESKASRWVANISFNYSGLKIDQDTNKIEPLSFLVTKYTTTRSQDLQ